MIWSKEAALPVKYGQSGFFRRVKYSAKIFADRQYMLFPVFLAKDFHMLSV